MEYVPPTVNADGFHCPHCQTFAKQDWGLLETRLGFTRNGQILDGRIGYCHRCNDYTLWVSDRMIFPQIEAGPIPHEDMPEMVKRDYEEARKVVDDSPRSAGALLRLALQRLMGELDAEGGSLHDKIGNLVEEGRISKRTQEALDAVRVIGNESVHPGEMDMDDDRETAMALFALVNGIIQETIALDKLRSDLYDSIPESKRQGIENRDTN